MKKSILLIYVLMFFSLHHSYAQSAWIDTGFDNYNGTAATTPQGLYINWHSASPASFYTSTGNFGISAPSYKFGNDSDFIATTMSIPMVDSITFWVKGNGAPFSVENELRFYQSSDNVNWNLFMSIDSLPLSGTSMTVLNNGGTYYYKIMYYKFPGGGNLAFDDFKIYSNASVGLNKAEEKEKINIYPSPTTGIININLGNQASVPKIELFDMLGNKVMIKAERKSAELYTMDLGGKQNGFYFIKIHSAHQQYTRKITLSN